MILVFVLQNLRTTKVEFITASGKVPLAVALLAATALGALLVLAVGSIRIIQLRRVIHRSGRAATKRRGPVAGASRDAAVSDGEAGTVS